MRKFAMAFAMALGACAALGTAPCADAAEIDWDIDVDAATAAEPAGADVGAGEFMEAGVVYDERGQAYTWYSERVLPGGGLAELNANGRNVDADGYVVDGDGYIAVASPDWSEPIGAVRDTPLGPSKVYDRCSSGAYDVYTSW